MLLRNIVYLSEVLKNQYLDESDLNRLQQKRLKAILNYAYENVRFYRRMFDRLRVKPSDIKTVGDLSRLRITTKADFRRASEREFLGIGFGSGDCIERKTSGSTGEPARFFFDRKGWDYHEMVALRAKLASGLRPWDRVVVVENPMDHPIDRTHRFVRARLRYLSFFDGVIDNLARLVRFRPTVLVGCPSYVGLLAEAVKEHPEYEIKPRIVMSTSEALGRNTRKSIEETLDSEVFDLYGSTEFHSLAWECPEHSGYHMDVDHAIIEFVNDNEQVAPGESGAIVITGLMNRAMPLLRYKIGDVGVPIDEKCQCGRKLPLMKNIDGRDVDHIMLPSGQVLSPYLLTCAIEESPNIAKFQVVQETRNEIRIKLQGKEISKEDIGSIVSRCRSLLGEGVVVTAVVTEDFHSDTPKFRPVLSKINS
jgi:phenylacetate-CoA ligase